MDSFEGIIRKRALPGILIFNARHELVYISREASGLLSELAGGNDPVLPGKKTAVPEEIYLLLDSLKKSDGKTGIEGPCHYSFISSAGGPYSVRAVPLYRSSSGKNPSHTMVILERCAHKRKLDINKVKERFNLTEREAEVVGEIAKGATNHEIASTLSISEHTVKDHVKNIMNKFGVNSRTLIISHVFE